MPSLKSVVSFALLTSLTAAFPARSPGGPSASTPGTPSPANGSPGGPPATVSTITTPTMPLSGDAVELPSPTGTLKFAAIGRGIQNYTCSAVGAVPASIGALANLFDATALASSNPSAFAALPGQAVMTPADSTDCFVLPAANKNLAPLGKHFFLADLTPTFDLTTPKLSIEAAKNTSIAAPSTAATGPNGSTAVAWLFLTAKASPYVSVGLSEAYRVQTAGGNAPATCTTTGVISVQYAAQYWFYGP